MQITLSVREIKAKGKWDEVCAKRGLKPTQLRDNDQITFRYDDAVSLGLTKEPFDRVELITM